MVVRYSSSAFVLVGPKNDVQAGCENSYRLLRVRPKRLWVKFVRLVRLEGCVSVSVGRLLGCYYFSNGRES